MAQRLGRARSRTRLDATRTTSCIRSGYAWIGRLGAGQRAQRHQDRRPTAVRNARPSRRQLLVRHLHPGRRSGSRDQADVVLGGLEPQQILGAGESQSAIPARDLPERRPPHRRRVRRLPRPQRFRLRRAVVAGSAAANHVPGADEAPHRPRRARPPVRDRDRRSRAGSSRRGSPTHSGCGPGRSRVPRTTTSTASVSASTTYGAVEAAMAMLSRCSTPSPTRSLGSSCPRVADQQRSAALGPASRVPCARRPGCAPGRPPARARPLADDFDISGDVRARRQRQRARRRPHTPVEAPLATLSGLGQSPVPRSAASSARRSRSRRNSSRGSTATRTASTGAGTSRTQRAVAQQFILREDAPLLGRAAVRLELGI